MNVSRMALFLIKNTHIPKGVGLYALSTKQYVKLTAGYGVFLASIYGYSKRDIIQRNYLEYKQKHT